MRSREGWLTAMSAVLGVNAFACSRDATSAPAAVREVPSVSAPAPIVAASAPLPETSASAIAIASASASAVPSASASPGIPIGPIGLGNIGTIGHNLSCGARAACGASPNMGRMDPSPNVTVQVFGGDAQDARVAQTQLRARVRACARNAAAENPNEHGDAMLVLSIDAHGAVTSVDPQNVSLGAPNVACMKAAVRSIKFAEAAARTLRVLVHVDRSQ